MRKIELNGDEGLRIIDFLKRHFEKMRWRPGDFDVHGFRANYKNKQFTFYRLNLDSTTHHITIIDHSTHLKWHWHNCYYNLSLTEFFERVAQRIRTRTEKKLRLQEACEKREPIKTQTEITRAKKSFLRKFDE